MKITVAVKTEVWIVKEIDVNEIIDDITYNSDHQATGNEIAKELQDQVDEFLDDVYRCNTVYDFRMLDYDRSSVDVADDLILDSYDDSVIEHNACEFDADAFVVDYLGYVIEKADQAAAIDTDADNDAVNTDTAIVDAVNETKQAITIPKLPKRNHKSFASTIKGAVKKFKGFIR